MKKKPAIVISLMFLLIFSLATYIFFHEKSVSVKQGGRIAHGICLAEDEVASYEIKKKDNEVSIANIIISDKSNRQEQYRFQIELPIPDHYHPIELHKCGIYAVRSFNYDYVKKQAVSNYRIELWRYNYARNGESITFLSGPISGKEFGTDFRIDNSEKYLALEKGYLGKEDYSIVIKDLGTKEDIFVLSMKNIAEQYSNIAGNFGLDQWTKDSRYFWGDIFDGAYVNGYFRIDTQNWKTDIYEAPDGAMGGSPLNINTGYLAIQPGQVWTGDYQLTEELKEQYKKEGKKSELYLYNLFTKEKMLIETTDEPLFWFKPKWLSDTELEYELPNGEKKVYEILAK